MKSNLNVTPILPFNPVITPSNGAADAYANITGSTQVVANAIAGARSEHGPASATAIVHAGPYPGFILGYTLAKATATAGSAVSSSAYAAAYTSNPYFSSVDVYGSTTTSGVAVTAGFFFTSSSGLQFFIDASLPLTYPTTPTNNSTSQALLSETIFSSPAGFQGVPHSYDAGFEGTLGTNLLPPEDLVIKITPASFELEHLQLTILLDQNIQVSQSYNNLTFGPKPIYFDLGPMQSFGPDPLDLQVDLNATSNAPQMLGAQVAVYDMNPALLTPEPTSLSLLTAATLPLLLKRRRKN